MAEKLEIAINAKDNASSTFRSLGANVIALNQSLELAKKAFAALSAPISKVIKEGSDFSKQMSNLAAVSKTSAKEFSAFSAEAKRIGETTAFTATQAAKGMEELRRAGLSAAETLATTQQAMALSSATGLELSTAAGSLAINLQVFAKDGLKASEAVDLLTQTAGASATTIEALNSAIETAQGTAAGMGVSFENLTVILGAMANAGVRGEKAGTALNGALSRLANPTAEVAKTLEKLGIELSEVNPEINDFGKILDTVKDSGASTADILSIFGQEAGPKFIKVVQDGSAGLATFAKNQKEANTAVEASKIRLNNLSGDVTILKSAISGISLKVFESIEPILRSAAKWATQFATNFSKSLDGAKQKIGEFLIAAGKMIVAISQNVAPVLSYLGDDLNDFWEMLVKAINSSVDAVKALVDMIAPVLLPAFKLLLKTGALVLEFLNFLIRGIADTVEGFNNLKIIETVNTWLIKLDEYGNNVKETFNSVATSLDKVVEKARKFDIFKTVAGWIEGANTPAEAFDMTLDGNTLTESLKKTADYASDLGGKLITLGQQMSTADGSAKKLDQSLENIPKETPTAGGGTRGAGGTGTGRPGAGGVNLEGLEYAGLEETLKDTGKVLGSQVVGLRGAIAGAESGGVWGAIAGAVTDIALSSPKVQEAISKLNEVIIETLAPVFESLVPILEGFLPILQALAPAIKSIASIVKVAATYIGSALTTLGGWISSLSDYFTAAFLPVAEGLKTLQLALEVLSVVFTAAFNSFLDTFRPLARSIQSFGEAFVKELENFKNALKGVLETLASPLIFLRNVLTDIKPILSGLWTSLNLIKDPLITLRDAIVKLSENVGSVTGGGNSGVPVVGGIISTVTGGLFKEGGEIPKAENGMLVGRSHAAGGQLIEAEGGEYILSKSAVDRVGRNNIENINNNTAQSNIVINVQAINPRSQSEEIRRLLEEMILTKRLSLA